MNAAMMRAGMSSASVHGMLTKKRTMEEEPDGLLRPQRFCSASRTLRLIVSAWRFSNQIGHLVTYYSNTIWMKSCCHARWERE